MINRGNHAEIDIFPGEPLDNPLAGNVVDLCPVGALLDKDFLHRQRAWFLSKHNAVCTRCSTGCNITAEENRGTLWRFKPRHNPHVNDYWICDEGRYSYKAANDPDLLAAMYVRREDDLQPAHPPVALKLVDQRLKEIVRDGGVVAGMLSPFLTIEEAYLLCRYLKQVSPSSVLAMGPVPTRGVDQTFLPDPIKGAPAIRASSCRGLSPSMRRNARTGAGSPPSSNISRGSSSNSTSSSVARAAGEFQGLFAASDSIDPWIDLADSEALRSRIQFVVLEDTTVTPLAQRADVVLAGATFAEKAGSYVNALGRLQYSEAALPPRDGSLADLDILCILLDRPGGPAVSSDILAELAEAIPAFSAARGGKLPPLGIPLWPGQPTRRAVADVPSFTDAWNVAHGVARWR